MNATATIAPLGAIPLESIDRITWVGLSGKLYFMSDRTAIAEFVQRFASVDVKLLDGVWNSIESQPPYRSFLVVMKP